MQFWIRPVAVAVGLGVVFALASKDSVENKSGATSRVSKGPLEVNQADAGRVAAARSSENLSRRIGSKLPD